MIGGRDTIGDLNETTESVEIREPDAADEKPRRVRIAWLLLVAVVARSIARLRAFGVARCVAAAAGLGLVAIGAMNAINDGSTTAILIVGGVLAALALIEWDEFTARIGDTSVSGKRRRREEAREAIETVAEESRRIRADPNLPEEVKNARVDEVIEAAADEVEEAISAKPAPNPASHRRIPGGAIELTFTRSTVLGMGARYRCTVIAPDGFSASTIARPQQQTGLDLFSVRHRAIYPRDFPDAPSPLPPGTYHVEWEHERGTGTFAVTLLMGAQLVAIDRFRIRP